MVFKILKDALDRSLFRSSFSFPYNQVIRGTLKRKDNDDDEAKVIEVGE